MDVIIPWGRGFAVGPGISIPSQLGRKKLHSGDGISVAGSSNIELMVEHLVQHQVVYFWERFASYQKEAYLGGLSTITSGIVDEYVAAEASGTHQPPQISTIAPNVCVENKGLLTRISGRAPGPEPDPTAC